MKPHAIVTIGILIGIRLAPMASAAPTTLPVTGRDEPKLAAFDELMLRFMCEHGVPGAAMAIARGGKIVYARGFGYADTARHQPVQPDSLFRIASVSKPLTGTAVLQLQERGKLRLTDPAFALLNIKPHLEQGAAVDPRLAKVTIEQLLHHTGGFDREASFDPMFKSVDFAAALGVPAPAGARDVITYMMGRPLDFDPGTKEVYSNYGYCVLGRVIEAASGQSYEDYVRQEILKPLGITRMRIGHSLESGLAPGEVRYYSRGDAHAPSVFGDHASVPVAYGGWCIEAMDAHGGWIASAPELVRFASALDDPDRCPILKSGSIEQLFARPQVTGYTADGKPKDSYYGCGWAVRPCAGGKASTWHTGLLDGSCSLLVRRFDGLTWAVLFNGDYDDKQQYFAGLIDPLLHPVADSIKDWPEGNDFTDVQTP